MNTSRNKAREAVRLSLREKLFHPDGTLVGLSYSRAHATRGAAIKVTVGRKKEDEQPKLMTSLTVDGKDFFRVYEQAVALIAEHYGLSKDRVIMREMRNTVWAFLKIKGLSTKNVVIRYSQLIDPSAPSGKS